MDKAADLMPPGVTVLDCIGVSVGLKPEVVAVAWLSGLAAIVAVAKLVFGFSIPLPFLLLLTLALRLILPLAEGLIVSDLGFSFTGWDWFRGEPKGEPRPAAQARAVVGRVLLWTAPVRIGAVNVWMTRGQIARLHDAERRQSESFWPNRAADEIDCLPPKAGSETGQSLESGRHLQRR